MYDNNHGQGGASGSGYPALDNNQGARGSTGAPTVPEQTNHVAEPVAIVALVGGGPAVAIDTTSPPEPQHSAENAAVKEISVTTLSSPATGRQEMGVERSAPVVLPEIIVVASNTPDTQEKINYPQPQATGEATGGGTSVGQVTADQAAHGASDRQVEVPVAKAIETSQNITDLAVMRAPADLAGLQPPLASFQPLMASFQPPDHVDQSGGTDATAGSPQANNTERDASGDITPRATIPNDGSSSTNSTTTPRSAEVESQAEAVRAGRNVEHNPPGRTEFTGTFAFVGRVKSTMGFSVEDLAILGYDTKEGLYGATLGASGSSVESPLHVTFSSGDEQIYIPHAGSIKLEHEKLIITELELPAIRGIEPGVGVFANAEDLSHIGFFGSATVRDTTIGYGVTLHLQTPLDEQMRVDLERSGVRLVIAPAGTMPARHVSWEDFLHGYVALVRSHLGIR